MEGCDEIRKRPSIFVVGCPNVGKRTLISRLASVEFEDEEDGSQVVVHGWTINTKYYTADVSVCIAHLQDGFSVGTLPIFSRSTALLMVFDMSQLSTLDALQDWVSRTDIRNFEILLCVGNKVDRISGHPVHAEYTKRLLKLADSSTHLSSDSTQYGNFETEGSSLLGYEDPSSNISRKCLEWCIDHNIEFIETCASNAEFDKCLSVDGDLQGVERVYGALSAHMWPGMVLKSGDKITEPSLTEEEESSEEEPDYQFDYEVLSAGSAEPWDETGEEWVSASAANTVLDMGKSIDEENSVTECVEGNITRCEKEELQPFPIVSASEEKIDRVEPNAREPEWVSASAANTVLDMGKSIDEENSVTECVEGNITRCANEELQPFPIVSASEEEIDRVEPNIRESDLASASELNDGTHYDFEDLEQLMSEIGNIRSNLRLMPDFQRREMAAKLAMKMAAMFGGGSDDEAEI
ncbi:uncharacterized protein LOC111296681 isoform X2 [Durio zibethinus]|nr:uncharacterized protein LOC111296681 isoform X2 [Durio zibethinus]XP_022746842.1 uncharacterized protein LOC111296681 isoform X2 [Durio zibethinus]